MNEQASIRNMVNIPIHNDLTADFYTFKNLCEPDKEHLALGLGNYRDVELPVVRVHSECITGDLFGSKKCDCGAQLHDAINFIHKEGGILIYLRQEGRGIGLYNKIDSYVLQEKGRNTFEANQDLGFENDLRNYEVAAEMLRALGISNITLLSNNPEKASQLENYGVKVVKKMNTILSITNHNRKYMEAKAKISKHTFNLLKSEL